MEYYYSSPDKIFEDKNEIEIAGDEYRHLARSLRKKPGDKITFTDGRLNIFYCIIKSIDNEKLTCEIIEKKFNLYEPDIEVELYLGLLKNMNRFEFAVEKCVELGIKKIVPILTEHTIIKKPLSKNKTERLNKIILSAMKQSQRCFLPELSDAITLNEMIEITSNEKNKVILYEFEDTIKKLSHFKPKDKVILCIGPEGGFSEEEIKKFNQNNWNIMSLGDRKLRAETAAVVSVYNILNN
jgi:16S rRNA (uracil1498-N3)-methyltransferase